MKTDRRASHPYVKSVRSMTRDDLQHLREKSSRPVIQKLRESHHIILRLAASGLSQGEIAEQVGYTSARVSLIINSPAGQDQIARYRDMDTEEWRKGRDLTYESIMAATRKAWRQINDRLDEADEENDPVALGHLLKVADSGADRVGYHRRSTKENINMDFAASLERAIAARDMKVIEHEE